MAIDRPHSIYLQIAHAFGWWGLVFYLAVVAGSLYKAIRFEVWPPGRVFSRGCWLGILGFHVAGIFTDGGPAVWPVFAVVFGSAASGGFPPLRRLYWS